MNSKEQQRKSIALIFIAILFYIYLDKVLFPYLSPEPVAKKSVDQGANEVEPSNVADTKKPQKGDGLRQGGVAPQALNEEDVLANEVLIDQSEIVTVNTDFYTAKVTNVGGRILSLKLKNYKKNSPNDSELLDMVKHIPGTPYPGGVLKGGQSDLKTQYQITQEDSGHKLVMRGKLPDGEQIEKVFSFKPDSYLFDINVKTIGDSLSKEPFSFEWVNQQSAEEAGLLDAYNVVGFVWFQGETSERLEFAKMTESNQEKKISCAHWLGLGDKYFSSAIIAPNAKRVEEANTGECSKEAYPKAEIKRKGNAAFMTLTTGLENDGNNSLHLQVYSGPKSYPILENVGFELKRLVDLGKTGFISAPLLSFLNFFYRFVGNYGLAIVLLTICVKLCLYPLNTTQYRQMKALQALKPEMDRIKDNIKDKQQQQLAMMELYKKKGVNPLGGCLPALVQMPIFIGLYSALMLAVELRHAPYGMWVHDLSAPDKLVIGGIGIPVLVVLFTISIMVQQWITPSNMDPAQKKVMMIMPVVMFFMFMSFPAGLALYWLTNNLISIGQQEAIKYGDKSGKSGLGITLGVAAIVFAIAYIGTLL